jgi:hypothetical protein
MWRPLLVCACLVLAGCSLPGGPAAEPTETGAVTPAPVPADRGLAPGLGDEGVTAPRALADAHAAALADRSYTLRANRTIRYPNGTVRERLTVHLRLGERRAYLVETATAGPEAPVFLGRPPANATFYSDGTIYLRRLSRDGETTYNAFEPVGGAGTWQYWARTVPFGGEGANPRSFVLRTFRAVPTTLAATETIDGERHYRLEGNRTTAPFEIEIDAPRAVTLRATVTAAGLVRELSLSYEGVVDGERVLVTRRVAYKGVGSTSVERPEWADRAR